ncbi:hypothetical protein ACJ41O_010061 [Fusarium nematophilum]
MAPSRRHRRSGFSKVSNSRLRNAFSSLDVQHPNGDSDSEDSEKPGDFTGTEASTTQDVANQDPEPTGELMTNQEAVQAIAGLPREFDAQALYSPDACVFVANLAQSYDDLTLQSAVTKSFGQFGTVFVKIKRDRRHMPFAFCQFTEPLDAQRALVHGRGMDILGRPCRTEKCNANLVYLVFRKNSRRVQFDEAKNLLRPYGAIAKVEDLDHKSQQRLRLPPTVVVQYEMFDARRDVVKSVGHNTPFMIMPYDAKVAQDASERDPTDVTFMEMYDRDRRSAFFGCLPAYANEDFVHSLASVCGTVLSVQLKETRDTYIEPAIYAFVEFDRADAPDEAVRTYNGKVVEGVVLRVERKKARTPMMPIQPATFGQIPPNRPHRRTTSTYTAGGHETLMLPPTRPHASGSGALVLANSRSQHVGGQCDQLYRSPHHRQYSHARQPSQAQQLPQRDEAVVRALASQILPDYTPLSSPRRLPASGVGVRFASSPAPILSQVPSPSVEYSQPQPVSPASQPSVLGPSFAERISDRRVTYAYSETAEKAAQRAELATKHADTANPRRAVSTYQPREPCKAASEGAESDSDAWQTCETDSPDAREQQAGKGKKGKGKAVVRCGHLSAENLKRNRLSEEMLKRAHRSEDNLKLARLSRENLKALDDAEKSPRVIRTSRKSDADKENAHEAQDIDGPSIHRHSMSQAMHQAMQQALQQASYVPMVPQYQPVAYPGVPYGYMPVPYQHQVPYHNYGNIVYQMVPTLPVDSPSKSVHEDSPQQEQHRVD